MNDTVLIEEPREGVRLITLNRPRVKNAFSSEQWTAFGEALNAADADPEVTVAVVTGAGGNFSSGVDLSSFGESGDHSFKVCQDALFSFDKPLIGAVPGVAVGGGATLLLHCDLVFVGESLRMRFPFASLGLAPELGSSHTLQRTLGYRRAAELFFTAEWIDAPRAEQLGLANAVLPDGLLLEHALVIAGQIARWPVSSLAAIKRTMKRAHVDALSASAEMEFEEMSKLVGSPENVEAMTAFFEKRDPDFRKLREKSG